MKKKGFVIGFLTLILVLICVPTNVKNVFAESSQDVVVLDNNSKVLSENYLDFYAISSSNFTYSNNGGSAGQNVLSNAFDRNFNTCFKSLQDNNVAYTDDTTGETKQNFINYIDINFNQTVCINRILYGAESVNTFRGYPTVLNIYANINNTLTLINTFNSTETTNMVVFNLKDNISTNKIRFEYVKVSTRHKYVASAREIMFLQPESSEYDSFNNMFTDYCELTLNKALSTEAKLNSVEDSLKNNINYNETIKPKFDRARQILSRELTFDESREFSTNSSAKNVINRYGNIDSFCRNTLNMSSFGTNRQVCGISAKPNQSIVIYVDCNDSDPLPTIRFSQNHGHWSGWLSGNYQLKKGKNVLTVPYLKNSNYTINTVDGGAIYIVNPYTSNQQSENVKLYFQNGELYPVYKKGQDEQEFLTKLNSYYQNLQQNESSVIDITEIVTDHIIFSGSASKAYEIFKNFSPKQCVLNWDSYMDSLLSFGGMDCNESGKYYNQMYKHINANIRVSQPWSGAAAYAYTEHIGIYTSWEATGYYAQNFGWGISHELGHMLDTRGQIIGESTNNMYAKFNETALEKIATRGNFDQTLNALSSDNNLEESYFNQNRLNFLIWWYIESYNHGFWADLQNCYRELNKDLNNIYEKVDGLKQKVDSLNATEKQVFYASVVTKIDMSYYYDRWGFNLVTTDSVFKQDSASETFKECLNELISRGYATNTKQPKLWYQDSKQFNLTYNKNCSIYNQQQKPVIDKVIKTKNGNSIFFKGNQDERHLGYEVLVSTNLTDYKVIAFSKGESYLDNNSYSTVPSYKIRAVDRMFNTTDYSNSVSANQIEQEAVCKIADTFYNSITEAIENANSGDEIIILKSLQEGNFIVNKNLTLKVQQSNSQITINKAEIGNFITINKGVTLNIVGLENMHLIIDGGGYSQNSSLFNVLGTLQTNFVDFVNSKSLSNGAVIFAGDGANITIKNALIKNNSATNGGVFYLNYASNKLNLQNANITYNNSQNAGAVLYSKGTAVLNNCQINFNNANGNGVIYSYDGGILKLNNSQISNNSATNGGALFVDGYTEINNCQISNNTAKNNGGAIYYSSNVNVRQIIAKKSTFFNNTAKNGKDVFVNSGNLTLDESTILNGEVYVNGGNVNISSNSLVSGKVAINNGTVTLQNNLSQNINELSFLLINPQPSIAIINFQNFEFSEQDLSKIKVQNKNVKLVLNNNALLVQIVEQTKQNNLILIVLIITLSIVVIALVLFVLHKTRKRKRKVLSNKKQNIKDANK